VLELGDSQNLILMGTSMGSGPTCYLTATLTDMNLDYIGVILECPISSAIFTIFIQRIAENYPNIDNFLNYKYIANVDKPVFIIH